MRPRHLQYVLDDDGRPLPCDDVAAWGEWLERATRDRSRIVAQDTDEATTGTVRVSTVFLGLDHNWSGHGPPILWETMVFGGPLDGETDRYRSRDAALAGHQVMCQRVTAAQMKRP